MRKNKKILSLILARGGSKGLPRKNVKPLLGKPLIAWTIEQARDSRYIDRIVVSTEDKEIAQISEKYGAEVPFVRPDELARDESPGSEAILHAMNFFEKGKKPDDILLLLNCTNPIRYKQDIDGVIDKLIDNKDANSVVGVVKTTNEHPLWSFKLKSRYLARFIPRSSRIKNRSRQFLEDAYLPRGIYATWWEKYKKYKTFFQPNTLPYFFKREQKVDIDDEVDFHLAECILKKYLMSGGQ